MKKIVLIVAFIFATGSIINATSTSKEYIEVTSEDIEISELPSCAGDCVSRSRELVLREARRNGDDPNEHSIYMRTYRILYYNCYRQNCEGEGD